MRKKISSILFNLLVITPAFSQPSNNLERVNYAQIIFSESYDRIVSLDTVYSLGSATPIHYDEKTKRLYLATANHIFIKNERIWNYRLKFENGLSLRQIRISKIYEDLDLAFIYITMKEEEIKYFDLGSYKNSITNYLNNPLYINGCDINECWTLPDKVSFFKETDEHIYVKYAFPQDGKSGAPLQTSDGEIVGIVLSSQTNIVESLSWTKITSLATDAGIEPNLFKHDRFPYIELQVNALIQVLPFWIKDPNSKKLIALGHDYRISTSVGYFNFLFGHERFAYSIYRSRVYNAFNLSYPDFYIRRGFYFGTGINFRVHPDNLIKYGRILFNLKLGLYRTFENKADYNSNEFEGNFGGIIPKYYSSDLFKPPLKLYPSIQIEYQMLIYKSLTFNTTFNYQKDIPSLGFGFSLGLYDILF